MHLKVKYFARFRELTGKDSEEIQIQDGVSLSQVISEIRRLNPSLVSEKNLMVAVNEKFADENTTVYEGDQVAIFPRVSGG